MDTYRTRGEAVSAVRAAQSRGEHVRVKQIYQGRSHRNGPGPRAKVYYFTLVPKNATADESETALRELAAARVK